MSWQECTLGDVVTLKRGHDLPNDARLPGNVPVVSSSGFTGYHNEAKAEPPGVVTGRYGTIGEVFYVTEPYWPLNTALYAIDFHGNDPRFVAYFLRNQLRNYQSDKAAVPGVDRNVLHKIPVRCPDQAIQQRIVSTLSAYDDLIENNRRRIALLEEAARLLYREWFVHFRFPGHEHVKNVDGVPETFELLELGDFCMLRGGNAFKTKFQGLNSGDFPFIKVGDMNSAGNSVSITEANNWISEMVAKELKAKPFPSGTVIFAKIGEALKQNRVRIAVKDTIIDNNMMGAIPDEKVVSPAFLYYLLSSYDIASHASGAAVPFLTAGVLSKIRFSIPDTALRINFDSIVDPIQKQIANLQVQITSTARARDLLLPRLMDGRLKV